MYDLDYDISRIANETTKIPRTVKKTVSYLQKQVFCSSKNVLIFGGLSIGKDSYKLVSYKKV